jgi:hypothetical protein
LPGRACPAGFAASARSRRQELPHPAKSAASHRQNLPESGAVSSGTGIQGVEIKQNWRNRSLGAEIASGRLSARSLSPEWG